MRSPLGKRGVHCKKTSSNRSLLDTKLAAPSKDGLPPPSLSSSAAAPPSAQTSRVAAASHAAASAASHAFARISYAFSSAAHKSSGSTVAPPPAAGTAFSPGGGSTTGIVTSTPSSPAATSSTTPAPATPHHHSSSGGGGGGGFNQHGGGGSSSSSHHHSSSHGRKSRRRSSSTSTGRKRSTTIPAITAADTSTLPVSSPSATSGTSAASASAPASPSLLSSRVRMLSPKMQRSIRINENQVIMLWEKARNDHTYNNSGYLHKRSSDSNRWQLRWFLLYQNLLFYAENEKSVKPSGVILLEGCYCERLITSGLPSTTKTKEEEKQYCFAITYRRDNQRQYDLRAESEIECKVWIEAIRPASFNKVLLQKEELEQQHLHLLQIVESEKTAKSLYTQQVEELSSEIRKLRAELCSVKKTWSVGASGRLEDLPEDSEEIKKIKKVQSFFRGWLCRRRWKQIVEEYIRSPHAESMRKRNSLVFRMVEAEEEYVDQLNLLVSCFLRPFKMAASSKKPPCNHEDVNSIFLNSETLLFLHQIFLKGLSARMESWPTLVLDGGRELGSNSSSNKQRKTTTSTTMQLLGNTHLGDLFDMLLPMLSIYQEYVRNHHYSLQVLAECKQNTHFAAFLNRLEARTALQNRTLETFLTYPMHQIPRYIITLHELLAHTPHNHVERKSLDHARMQLEDLSRQMHDEVSETENIRKNLAIERMIVEGCDILLDVNQVFVRQGSLIQIQDSRPRSQKSRLTQFKLEKDAIRQCFLFSNHLIMATRTSGGKLHLMASTGKIPLQEAILIEDPSDQVQNHEDDGESSVCSVSSASSGVSESSAATSSGSGKAAATLSVEQSNLDFKIVWEQKSGAPLAIHLVAPTMQEKQAWISDISQCLDNVHFNNLFRTSMSDTSSITMPHYIKNDPRLFKDDIDIRFSRTLNSCKVPHIRYATPERLLERLTDLRFLSIDFLNTFLLTYRVFCDGVTVLEALKKVYTNPDVPDQGNDSRDSSVERSPEYVTSPTPDYELSHSPRRVSNFSAFSVEEDQREREERITRDEEEKLREEEQRESIVQGDSSEAKERGTNSLPTSPFTPKKGSPRSESSKFLKIPGGRRGTASSTSSADTIMGEDHEGSPSQSPTTQTTKFFPIPTTSTTPPAPAGPSPPAIASTTASSAASPSTPVLLVNPSPSKGLNSAFSTVINAAFSTVISTTSVTGSVTTPLSSAVASSSTVIATSAADTPERSSRPRRLSSRQASITSSSSPPRLQPRRAQTPTSPPRVLAHPRRSLTRRMSSLEEKPQIVTSGSDAEDEQESLMTPSGPRRRRPSDNRGSLQFGNLTGGRCGRNKRPSESESTYSGYGSTPRSSLQISTARSSFQVPDSPQHSVPRALTGVVITSSRQSQRRCSSASAAAAFAVATAGSSNPRDLPTTPQPGGRFSIAPGLDTSGRRPSFKDRPTRQESIIISTAATMRVLNVLRHWVSKHSQDFDSDLRLRNITIEFLQDLVCNPTLLPAENKAASQLLRLLTKEEQATCKVDLPTLLTPPTVANKETVETLSALELAEQMTYIDHQIFAAIRSEEFLKTAWMKADKQLKAANILLITKRFNDMSRLVVSEVIRGNSVPSRVAVIEKWVAVSDICRCLHNFNGVLQVCAAFQNSSVFRLKKTWEKVSKTTRQTLDKLQALVCSDGRFRSLRDALHRCDPPCIPYLGMYLTDLSFIEEGTPNFTDDGLLNFSKMRMIAHVIREIRHFQQTPYKIEHSPKVTNYLLDPSRQLSDDDLYRQSLEIEPRRATLTPATAPSLAVLSSLQGVAAHLQHQQAQHKADHKADHKQDQQKTDQKQDQQKADHKQDQCKAGHKQDQHKADHKQDQHKSEHKEEPIPHTLQHLKQESHETQDPPSETELTSPTSPPPHSSS